MTLYVTGNNGSSPIPGLPAPRHANTSSYLGGHSEHILTGSGSQVSSYMEFPSVLNAVWVGRMGCSFPFLPDPFPFLPDPSFFTLYLKLFNLKTTDFVCEIELSVLVSKR